MKTRQLLVFLAGCFALLVSSGRTSATITNTWEFDNPTNYVFDPQFVEVAEGQARLVLQAEIKGESSLAEYTNAPVFSNLRVDLPANVRIQGTSGQYPATATFTSRIIDAGVTGAGPNDWERLTVQAGFEPYISDPAVASYFPLDNSWTDQVTGGAATSLSGVGFTTNAAVGTHAATFLTASSRVTLRASNPLANARAFTIALWLNAASYRNYMGILTGTDASGFFRIRQGPAADRRLVASLGFVNGGLLTQASFVLNKWTHLAIVYNGEPDGGDGRLWIYIDGVPVTSTGPLFSTLAYAGPLTLGNDYEFTTTRGWDGSFDDIFLIRRALTSSQVEDLSAGNSDIFKPVRVQVRGAADADSVTNQPFVGPNGTESTFYPAGTSGMGFGAGMAIRDRFLQYKATLLSDADRRQVPTFHGVRFEGSRLDAIDDNFQELAARVEATNNTTYLLPATNTTAFVGLARRGNGGFVTNGFYVSRVFDAGVVAQWEQMSWSTGAEIDDSTDGLLALYHVNQTWNDSRSGNTPLNVGNAAYSQFAKAGIGAASFNGVNNVVDNFSAISGVRSIEFWIESYRPENVIVKLNASIMIKIVEGEINITGLGASQRRIYVNGSLSAGKLLPGWNHVAVTFRSSLTANELVFGQDGLGNSFSGKLDEIALYNRRLTSGEVLGRWAAGQGNFAGRVQFQVFNDDLQEFVGPGGLASTFFLLSPFGDAPNLLGIINAQRSFQYRVLLEGDGNASPMLQSVRIRASTPEGTIEFVDASSEQFRQGAFVERQTVLYGNMLSQEDRRSLGPRNTRRTSSLLLGLWPFDDLNWTSGPRPVLAEQGEPGALNGDAKTSPGGAVGSRYGVFNGGYINLLATALAAEDQNFSIGIWFRSTSVTASTLVSTDDAVRYFALRLNTADGTTDLPGAVTFAVNDASGEVAVTLAGRGLNDGNWHHAMGVRNGRQLLLYIDGILQGVREVATLGIASISPQLIVAKHPALLQYYVGGLDELIFYRRALPGGEIGSIVSRAGVAGVVSEYVSAAFRTPDPAIWERIDWVSEGPYARELTVPTDDSSLVGLWHFNEGAGAVINATAVAGLDGTAINALRNQPGRFGQAIDLPASGTAYVEVPHQAALTPAIERISVEAWISPRSSVNRAILDKRSGANGYALFLDASGQPTFWVGGTAVTAVLGVRNGTWTHVAGVYSGTRLDLFVNGHLVATAAAGSGSIATSVPLWFGRGRGGESNFDGLLDQMAIHSRTLERTEALDHYTAGAVSLKFQGRSGTNETITTPFVGPGASTNAFFTDFTGSSMVGAIPLNAHFQYRALFTTEDHRFLPRLYSVSVAASGYPLRAPTVEPISGFGLEFLGNLITFNHSITPNLNTDVRYQLTGDGGASPTWYFYDTALGIWTNQNVSQTIYPFQVNTLQDVRNNFPKLYTEIYNATGGVLRFRAFLKSDGERRTEINSVTAEAASGRIVILQPNGQEVGNRTFLADVPEDILWSSSNVFGTVVVDYSINGGSSWTMVADTNGVQALTVPVEAGRTQWRTPASGLQTQVLVRVTNNQEPTIYDVSDTAFQMQEGIKIVANNGNLTWYLGETNRIVWKRSRLANPVHLDFFPSPALTNFVRLTGSTLGTLPLNGFDWVTPFTNALLVSEAARLRAIETRAVAPYSDFSDATFTMAGAVFTRPVSGQGVRKDSSIDLAWTSAGMGSEVSIEIQESPGGPWSMIVSNAPNATGSNTYSWFVTNTPTETARLRMASHLDPRATGLSSPFKIAAIQIKSPVGRESQSDPLAEVWLQTTTQTVSWISAGASTNVHLDYSVDGGSIWSSIVSNTPNVNGLGLTNTFRWMVANRPSSEVRVRIRDAERPVDLFSISPYNFQIAGLRVIRPNGEEDWLKGVMGEILWEENEVGLIGRVEFSYDGGTNWATVSSGPVLANTIDFYTPTNPTVKAVVRITSDDPNPEIRYPGISDRSDTLFSVAGIRIVSPAPGERFTIGQTNKVIFVVAGTRDADNNAPIYYSANGTDFDFDHPINTVDDVFSESFPGVHTFNWLIERTREPSRNAVIAIEAGSFFEVSEPFILRGITFMKPRAAEVIPLGQTDIEWSAAGLATDAKARLLLSVDGNQPADFTQVLGTDFFVGDGTLPWPVPQGLGPGTNAYLKLEVTAASDTLDIGFTGISERFTLQGIRVTAPAAAATVDHGSATTISWTAAAAGALVDIQYSPNGGASFDPVPVATFVASSNGVNSIAWNVELARDPSTNAVIRVISQEFGAVYGQSPPFVLRGIKVTRPRGSDIYATTDLLNPLAWISVRGSGANLFDVFFTVGGGARVPIVSGTALTSLNWSIPPGAVADTVRIVVTDGLFTGTSAVFRVVSAPTIEISKPDAGAYWKIGTTRQIDWLRGGGMSNSFTVSYSPSPFVDEIVIASNVTGDEQGPPITFEPSLNTFSTAWSVPDRLGKTRIIVRNSVNPSIQRTSPDFYIVGQLRMLSPGAGTALFALKPNTPVVWETLGSVPFVDLYYSLSQRHEAESWIKINNAPLANNSKPFVLTDPNPWVQRTFPWTVINARTSLARVRVQESAYTNQFDAGFDGPFGDSSGDFTVRYYRVFWRVYDQSNGQPLDRIAVVDSSGWSASNLDGNTSVYNDYPWGKFSTEFYREGFFDASLLFWSSENTDISVPGPNSWTQQVAMTRSLISEEYRVLANFSYDAPTRTFTIHSWMERGGIILETPTSTTIRIFDEQGNAVAVLTNPSPQPNGVFWTVWNASALNASTVYFAKVEVTYSGFVYSSGLTFTLTPSLSEDIGGLLADVAAALTSSVAGNIGQLGADIQSLKDTTETGFTNLLEASRFQTNLLAQLRDDVANVTTQVIDVLGPQLALLQTNLTVLQGLTEDSAARILSRPDAVALGSTNTLLYKTQQGFVQGDVTMSVFQGSTQVSGPTALSHVVGGIYEVDYIASWGINTYRVTVSDPIASDSLALRVVAQDIYQTPTLLADVSASLLGLEEQITLLQEVTLTITNQLSPIVSRITDAVGSFSNQVALLAGLDTLGEDVSRLTNAISSIQTITNVQALVAQLTNALSGANWGDVLAIRADVDLVKREVGGITNTLTALSGLQDIASQISSVSNAVVGLGAFTNTFGQISELNQRLGALNFEKLISDVSATTNILSTLDGLQAISDQVGSLSNALFSISAITNVIDTVDALGASLLSIDFLSMSSNVQSSAARLLSLSELSSLSEQIKSLSNSVASILMLTNSSAQIDIMAGVLTGANFATMASDLRVITQSVASINWADILALRTDMRILTNSLVSIASLEQIAAELKSLTNAIDRLSGVTNLGDQVANLTNALKDVNWQDVVAIRDNVSSLTNSVRNLEVESLNAIVAELGRLTNAVGQLGAMTNVPGRVDALANALLSIDFGGMQSNVQGLTNKLAQFDWSVIAGLQGSLGSAISNQLGTFNWDDVTALRSDVRAITNALGTLPDLPALFDQLQGLTNLVAVASDVGALAGGISFLTNELFTAGAGVADTTNRLGQLVVDVNSLSTRLQSVNWQNVVEVQEQLTRMTASLSGLSGVDFTAFNSDAIGQIQQQLAQVASAEGLAELRSMLGTTTDSASQDSFFGRLAQLSGSLNAVGSDASLAASQAQSAKSSADGAESAIKSLQSAFETGNLDQAMEAIRDIQTAMGQAQMELQQVPKSVETEGLYATLTRAAGSINELAQSRGFPALMEGKFGAAEGADGAAANQQMIQGLQTQIQEMRGSMEFLTELMDEMRHQPVVKDQLLAVE